MQFSLRTILGIIAFAAVCCAVFFALPNWLSFCVLLFVTLVLPGATLGLIVYGRGYARAFAIGCAASPAAWVALILVPFLFMDGWEEIISDDAAPFVKVGFVVFHCMNGCCGLLAVAVRWWTLRTYGPKKQAADKGAEFEGPTDRYAILQGRISVSTADELPGSAALKPTVPSRKEASSEWR